MKDIISEAMAEAENNSIVVNQEEINSEVQVNNDTTMESSEEPSSLQSIFYNLKASELFPKPSSYECDDATLAVPYILLSGEYIVALGRTSDGVLALSNYRLYLQLGQGCYNVPLGLIEQLEVKEIFWLHILCKDARSISCAFSTNEACLEWFKRLHKVTFPRRAIEEMFAFAYYAWSMDEKKSYPRLGKDPDSYLTTFKTEVERLKFNLHGTWRISLINQDFKMCPSYPPQLLVPACISDEVLEEVAKFRSSRRIPAVVWRHVGNGAVIARSSQPEVGWLGWRSGPDEDLLKALADACSYDRGESTMIDDSPDKKLNSDDEPITMAESKKVLIVDARSYTTAVANRARGGGCECQEYYPSCDIIFMNLPNIHSIRKSFHAVRQLCASDSDQNNWLSLLENTRWLQHMSALLRAAYTVASTIEREGRPVLVHCSDGWDRTPQIVALAQILLDPYYRTMEGFQVLCEREWLNFGHKFADRCGQTVGSEDPNERCPVFLQWLDCVHQLINQFKCSFQMSPAYLVKLAQHTYSQLFGTFLCNTRNERLKSNIRERTFSVWPFLNSSSFVNHLYSPKNQVLWPSCNVRDLQLWTAVYVGTIETPLGITDIKPQGSLIDVESTSNEELQGQMTKTRSYGDLVQAQDHTTTVHRRLSDPSISMEKRLDSLSIENESKKVEDDGDSDNSEVISENNKETENKNNLLNGKLSLNKIMDNISADSSTDTIVPNGDVITKVNGEIERTLTVNNKQQLDAVSPVTSNNSNPMVNGNSHNDSNEGIDATENGVSTVPRVPSVPLMSRTPSSICPASPTHQEIIIDNFDRLDDVDGLPFISCDVQSRVQQIIIENKLKEEALKKELHTTRMALIKYLCNTQKERVDDVGSLPDSAESAGDPGESLPSDMSWETLEEPGPAPTLWVPDHAVSRCMGCNTEFWLGRRRHHCRSCGKIFCADCSENTTPLPSEQLYEPVRVCTDCFSKLNHHTSCMCGTRYLSKIENGVEPVLLLQAMPNYTASNCHQSATKGTTQSLNNEDDCESTFQLVQQKQNQPPMVEASRAN